MKILGAKNYGIQNYYQCIFYLSCKMFVEIRTLMYCGNLWANCLETQKLQAIKMKDQS